MNANSLIDDLKARGLIAQMTNEEELAEHLAQGPVTLYCGFDPTADSLHLGHLVPLLMLKRFQDAGHRPIALVGGATGLIGDPSFKDQERQLNSEEVVQQWSECLKSQISRFIEFDGADGAILANNYDWTSGVDVLSFLRDIGKHFTVNKMIAKESVKQRIEREGSGLSFTEFTYQILQSYDFQQLNSKYGCTMQIGGSDQWGNIVGGIELTRRVNGASTHALTLPLITKSDGTKFGKTEGGAVWLDAKKTSPYAFYQFWLQTPDADVYRFMKFFTFLPVSEIDAIEAADRERAGRPEAQRILAEQMTALVHGEEALQAARRITEALFSGDLSELSLEDYAQLEQDGLPATQVPADLGELPLTTLFADAGLASSGKQVKDALQRNAVMINDQACGMDQNMNAAALFTKEAGRFGKYFLVKLGKKKHHLFYLG
ncbi:tyrosine--tRNA ligase [Marinobacterium sediminicola]|uniref:Tyrosine--tRNA ligase n=1 Tax=Marinobacterium sediminicola TaxID=518898 RepID=A0ABY1S3R7_9GAMM|nr:tyrosine--tRNA ligase [Marinobacterium sediminicola]ULG68879.1 tyrosine--tRNA ligase [Marinobacterium sediminicola]SMR77919.1 tyrosyl-tRNA synthetase [Marinobacterium sediminicola]